MDVTEVVYAAVLRNAARGVLPAELIRSAQLWEASGGDGYAALEAALAIERARAAVLRRFVASRRSDVAA